MRPYTAARAANTAAHMATAHMIERAMVLALAYNNPPRAAGRRWDGRHPSGLAGRFHRQPRRLPTVALAKVGA